MPQPRILFENDSRHTLIYMYEPPISVEDHRQAVDELLGTPVEALLFNLGYGNAFLHGTEAGERWGPDAFATEPFRPGGGRQWEHVVFMRAYRNAAKLIAEGNDPLRLVSEAAHEHGLLLYPSLQANAALPEKELTIGAGTGLDDGFPGAQLGDFRHPEVRARRLALIEEVVGNYDVDGFELNLGHYAGSCFFHPEFAADKGREVFSGFLAEVSAAVRGSGPGRELAVRLPASPAQYEPLGFDPAEWCRQGLVDVILGESAAGAAVTDPTVDFRPLLKCAEGSGCRVHGVLRNHVDSDRLDTAPIEMIRAAACNYWEQGVDGLCCAHWCGNWPYGPEFYEQLRELPFPEVMAAKDKIYAIPTVTGRSPEPSAGNQLPAPLEPGRPARMRLPVSDDLPRWEAAGRLHEVILRIRITRVTERDRFRFTFNGRELPADCLRRIDHVYQISAPRFRSHSSYWFVFKLGPGHRPRRGRNDIEVTLRERDPEVTPEMAVRDVELEIRYLRGRSYHRGEHNTDPDLGPYQHAST